MRRLGLNNGGYFGEGIDIRSVLSATQATAQNAGWRVEAFHGIDDLDLLSFHRPPLHDHARHRVYISTGIHGDEPAGPLAVQQLIIENRWPESMELWICPCLNPVGFIENRRENGGGIDLNRDYRHLRAPEVRAHVAWMDALPTLDLALCLHEDWEAEGFYVYELNPDQRPSLAEEMIRQVQSVCPVDFSSEIEGRPAQGGIVRPNPDPATRPEWPEAFYLVQKKTRLSYTPEAPSDFPLTTRVKALVVATQAALDALR